MCCARISQHYNKGVIQQLFCYAQIPEAMKGFSVSTLSFPPWLSLGLFFLILSSARLLDNSFAYIPLEICFFMAKLLPASFLSAYIELMEYKNSPWPVNTQMIYFLFQGLIKRECHLLLPLVINSWQSQNFKTKNKGKKAVVFKSLRDVTNQEGHNHIRAAGMAFSEFSCLGKIFLIVISLFQGLHLFAVGFLPSNGRKHQQ